MIPVQRSLYNNSHAANATIHRQHIAPTISATGIALSIQNSRASRSARVCAWPHAPTSKRECLLFYSPVCSARTAPTPGGRCNQSSSAALFQVRS